MPICLSQLLMNSLPCSGKRDGPTGPCEDSSKTEGVTDSSRDRDQTVINPKHCTDGKALKEVTFL